MLTLNTKQKEFVDAAKKMYNKSTLSNNELKKVAKSLKVGFPQWLNRNPELRVGRGKYKLPLDGLPVVETSTQKTTSNNSEVLSDTKSETKAVENTTTKEAAYVISSLSGDITPKKDPGFVSFGNHPDVRNIVKSKQFYPIFITGLSGNGKTFSVVQACAESKREMIRVNITIETDEDDLLGGYRLKDGQTVWQNGPVIEAMERGAILLLDEIDLASNKIMCLQPILEGNGVYVKKINKFVKPANGFNVVATANTKGQGSDDGKFIGTNILNEAFLERFPVTFEQKYPAVKTEQKILNNTLAAVGKKDEKYVEKLSTWADVIRKTYFDGGVDEIISTRRLVHIVQAYSIFGNKMKAIELCTNRFDDDTKSSFVDLYTKVDAGATAESIAEEQKAEALKAQQMESNDSEDEEDEEDLV
jgi:MoxR-like ATPase|tara:strand:- start:193 stop:1443 length:1251 start_codon:yes stop_codon:yes gene_type:complete